MVIVWALSWWYSAGLVAQFTRLQAQLVSSYDYFSIGLLASTLFAPFRQISAGKINGPITLQLRAFFDRLISRIIGAFVRLILIIVGSIWLTIQVLLAVIGLTVWLVAPFLPLVGFVLMLSGWVPTWR